MIRKTQKKVNWKKLVAAAVVLLAAVICGVLAYQYTGNQQPSIEELMETATYIEGVTINGQPIGGMNVEQAMEAVFPVSEEKISQFLLTVNLEGKDHQVTGSELSLETNYANQLKEALKEGHVGNRKTRARQKKKAKKEGTNFVLSYLTNDELMETGLNGIYKETGHTASDASVRLNAGKLEYVEGQNGIKLNMDKLKADVKAAIEAGEDHPVVTGEVVEVSPAYTVDMLKEKLVKRGSSRSEFKSSDSGRAYNVAKAAGLINGQVILPGETFSINSVLGARSVKNDWKVSIGISNGKYIDDVGGGICQVSSTLYNAGIKAGLEVVERRHHSLPVSYLPLGQDAAISTGGPDLKLKNPYDFPIYIVASATTTEKVLDVMVYGPASEDGSSIVFKSKELSNTEPEEKAKVTENENLMEGEYVEVKPRKNRIEVKRWLEYVIDGKTVKTEELKNDVYRAQAGEYAIGKGTPVDETTGKPNGKKVDEKYLTTKRETTAKTTNQSTAQTQANE